MMQREIVIPGYYTINGNNTVIKYRMAGVGYIRKIKTALPGKACFEETLFSYGGTGVRVPSVAQEGYAGMIDYGMAGGGSETGKGYTRGYTINKSG